MATALIGAGISTVGSLIGAGKQEDAIKSAAGTLTNAANTNASLEAGATTAANTNTASNLNTTRAAEAPYQAAGATALGQLGAGTATGGQFNSTPTGAQVLAQDPGYQFQLDQGTQALQRAEAAGGSVGSGGALKAGVAYSQNYADSAYNNAYQQFMNTRQNNYSNLANIANYGQTANQVAATAGTAESGQIAGTTLAGTAAQTNYLGDAAQATATGAIGVANAQAGALGQIGTAAQGLNASGYGSFGGGSGPDAGTPTWNPATGSEMYPGQASASGYR